MQHEQEKLNLSPVEFANLFLQLQAMTAASQFKDRWHTGDLTSWIQHLGDAFARYQHSDTLYYLKLIKFEDTNGFIESSDLMCGTAELTLRMMKQYNKNTNETKSEERMH